MRRIALLAGLVLMAGTVQAQAVKCTQSRNTRLVSKASQFVNGVLKAWYVSADSVTTTCTGFPSARVDTVFVPAPPADTTPTPPPPPPADTTPKPPTDTVVTPPPSGQATLFSSDWSGGLLDGGKWTRWGGASAISVVPATGLGFPTGMANVLRVSMGTGAFDWVQTNAKWTLPAVGESRAFRIYYLNAQTASGGWASTHPIEGKGTDGSFSGNVYHWNIGSKSDGTAQIAMGTPAAFPRNWISTSNTTTADVGTLPKKLYRLEWKFTRTGTATYSLDIRISDAAGAIVESSATMRAWGGGTLASNNGGIPVDAASITGFRVGINGGQGGGPVYWGGFAVCTDWCGAY